MDNLYESVEQSAAFLRRKTEIEPRVAIVLGTGLGGVAERIRVSTRVSFSEIPHFPLSTVTGHKGDLLFGTLAGCPVVAMQGRVHYYEGYTLQQVTFPVRVMRKLGAEALFLNSAAGGLNPLFRAGDVMVVTDHINLLGDNPLRGVVDPRLGNRFPDLTRPYDQAFIDLATEAALDMKTPLRHGVYAAVPGPSLETRAETRMLRMLGADAVGMSTVPEVIVGCQVGFRIMVLSAITNVNLPDVMEPVLIENVIACAHVTESKLGKLMEATIQRAFCQSSSGRIGIA